MVVEISNDIWTMDGPDLVFAGASMNTRMTVVRLQDGCLWVHSPIELNAQTRAFLNDLGGDVAALVGPNKFHHLFIEPWREAFPDAVVFAEEELRKKIPSLSTAELLSNQAASLYANDIDQVIFGGNRMFQEAVFFHRASRSLIFTDLMVNLKADGVSFLPRMFLKFEGVTYPNGGIPRLYRWFTNDKAAARAALNTIRGWQPQRVLFCHGEPLELPAQALLEREFSYLD